METDYDVVVVGGGVAGLTAAVYTARASLDTLVVDDGDSILRRNAHLENVPGFPAGIDARLFLEMLGDQADRAGCDRREATVTGVEDRPGGFRVETTDGDCYGEYLVAATKNEVDYLRDLPVGIVDRGKAFVDADEGGRTEVDGLYAAGRLAGKPHQAAVCAGHGAETAVSLLEDDDSPFYHDWVTPEGYFTDRGRDLPPGCEEIDREEHRRRERESREVLREYLSSPPPGEPRTHPSLRDDD